MTAKIKHVAIYSSSLFLVMLALHSWLSSYLLNPESVSYQELQTIQEQVTELSPSNKILPPQNGMYFGAFADFGQHENSVTESKIIDFTELVNKKIAWAYFSDNWFESIQFPKETVELLDNLNITPYIRIMPRIDFRRNPFNSPYTLERINNGEYDNELKVWAKEAKDSGVPIMLEFGTEVNGRWFPWNGIWNGDSYINSDGLEAHSGVDLYISTYRHVIDIFREEEVNNVTWVYHVNARSAPDKVWNDLDKYYPGDDYIDWVGVSVYGAQSTKENWVDFDSVYSQAYNKITAFTSKPIGIVELGVAESLNENEKAKWIADALQSLESGKYPATKAVSYWHSSWESDGAEYNLRIDSSNSAQVSFREGVGSNYFLSQTLVE